MPPVPTAMPMLAELRDARPKVDPFLPFAGVDPDTFPEALPREVVDLADGDTLALEAVPVRRRIGNRTIVLYGFNGMIPGPLVRVPKDAEVTIVFTNRIDLPTTVHWHGIRLENRFDGVPGVTQELVQPGGTFVYQVRFPDAGIYWYHPHHREDVTQDLGLYGNLLVAASDPDYYPPAHRDEVVTLDDLLLDAQGVFPYGAGGATHALMGRFGNVYLVDGEPRYRTTAKRGEVVRFHLTNVSNTRVFNLVFGGARVKLLATDVSRFEREAWVESVVLAPAERYVVDVRFDEPGSHAIMNRIQAIDHFWGRFEARTDTLGVVEVVDEPAEPDLAAAFETLRENAAVAAEMGGFEAALARPADRELVLDVTDLGLHRALVQVMALDTLYVPPVEWNDVMPMMNWISSREDVRWILRDPATGKENLDIDWRFRVGDVAKIRITNLARSLHPMQHPIHLHGQRFLVAARDGVENGNLAWKDTAVVPVGSTVDLVVDFTNPGDWMLHCHISEHLETGMKTVIRVDERDPGNGLSGSP